MCLRNFVREGKFKTVYILGAREFETGEMDNIRREKNVHLITDCRYIPEDSYHVHIDADVMDPQVIDNLRFPVPRGTDIDGIVSWIDRIVCKDIHISMSNFDGDDVVLQDFLSSLRYYSYIL